LPGIPVLIVAVLAVMAFAHLSVDSAGIVLPGSAAPGTAVSLPAAAPAPDAPGATRILVLPARYDGDDPAAEQVLESVLQATLAVLNDAPEVSIMTLNAAQLALLPPNAASGRSGQVGLWAVVGRYGADVVAEISEDSAPDAASWNLRMSMSRQSGAAGGTSVPLSKTGEPGPSEGVQGIGERFASRILGLAARSVLNSGIRNSASRLLLDTTLPVQERVNSLIRLSVFVMNRDEIDAAAVLAAELSTPAMTRRVIWQTLARTAFEPALVEPLRRAMLSDPDPLVRAEAATALQRYIDVGIAQ
jgi:hypothetical protein